MNKLVRHLGYAALSVIASVALIQHGTYLYMKPNPPVDVPLFWYYLIAGGIFLYIEALSYFIRFKSMKTKGV